MLAAQLSLLGAVAALALAGVIASQGGGFGNYGPMLFQTFGFLVAHVRARASKADSFQILMGLTWLTVVLFDDGFIGQGITWIFYIPLSLGIILFAPRGWNQNIWLASIPVGMLLVGATDWTPRMNRFIPEESAYFTRSSNFGAAILASILALRYMLEQHAEALAKAVAANRAKSEFLSRMSHEFRTPLNAISGFTELLELDPVVRREGRRDSLQAIRTSAEHLLGLVNGVLDLASLESGRLTLNKTAFAPRQALDELAATLTPLASSKGLEIQLHATALPRIHGDRLRWLQVLLNLAGNGVRYTESGHIAIHASWDPAESSLWVEIRDTGPGIPPDKLETIFEPYTRLAGSQPIAAQGTGLGLAISRQIVETMGGTLTVESRVGKGTCFSYHQPFEPAGEEAAPPEPAPRAPQEASLSGTRVLLCEDTRMNVALASRILGQLGATFEVAEDGRQALEKLREGGWDLVLLDIHMPFHDGYEVARAIRDPRSPIPCKTVPILALTADASADTRTRALEAGMDDLLTKPFRVQDLARHASALVAR